MYTHTHTKKERASTSYLDYLRELTISQYEIIIYLHAYHFKQLHSNKLTCLFPACNCGGAPCDRRTGQCLGEPPMPAPVTDCPDISKKSRDVFCCYTQSFFPMFTSPNYTYSMFFLASISLWNDRCKRGRH